MPDWTDPSTWRDVEKIDAVLKDLAKSIDASRRAGESSVPLDAAEGLLDALRGHQKALADVSFVTGKLVAYTTAAHEERRLEVDAIHDLSKSLKQLTRTIDKLTKRVDTLERKAGKPVKAR